MNNYFKRILVATTVTLGIFTTTGIFAELRDNSNGFGSKFDVTCLSHYWEKEDSKDWTYQAEFQEGTVIFFFKSKPCGIFDSNIPYKAEFQQFSNDKIYGTKNIKFTEGPDEKSFYATYEGKIEIDGVKYKSLNMWMVRQNALITPGYSVWIDLDA
ncbi:MAG: hypothetical protein Q8L98_04325 [Chlamydiales bacterium]|nr:hypothetical protein [Chlamydiales bacterium]